MRDQVEQAAARESGIGARVAVEVDEGGAAPGLDLLLDGAQAEGGGHGRGSASERIRSPACPARYVNAAAMH
jgi:hypothetical protein